MLELAEAAAPQLEGPDQVVWAQRLEAERDNLRAALGWWAERGAVEAGLRLANALLWFWFNRGYWTEGGAWLERFLGLSEAGAAATGDPADWSPGGGSVTPPASVAETASLAAHRWGHRLPARPGGAGTAPRPTAVGAPAPLAVAAERVRHRRDVEGEGPPGLGGAAATQPPRGARRRPARPPGRR